MQIDYLLYDNRTLGETGRDWALKVATGALADDRRVRGLFVEHCRRSYDARLGALQDFGAALGGFPLPRGGYLLCVTLEMEDLARRPTCGFVGMHCPGTSALRTMLEAADPVATARAVYEAVSPPSRLAPRGRALLAPERADAAPSLGSRPPPARFAPFVRDESPRQAAVILRRAIDLGWPLPSILGIASWLSRRALAPVPERFVFYQGLPADFVAEPPTDDRPDMPPPPEGEVGKPAPSTKGDIVVLLLLVAVMAAVLLLPRRGAVDAPLLLEPATTPLEEESEDPEPVSEPEARDSREEAPEQFLERIEPLVTQMSRLDPQELQASAVYRVLEEVGVREEHRDRREGMRSLLESGLPEFKSALVNKHLLHYFEVEVRADLSSTERAAEVRRHLEDLALPEEGCHSLREAFAALMVDPDQAPAVWCQIVEALARERQPGREG